MANQVKTKEEYQAEVTQRLLQLADALTGKTKKYATYGDFFATLTIPVSWRKQFERGERHVSPYHLWLCRTIHGASDAWLLAGDGDMFGKALDLTKVREMEAKMAIIELRLNDMEKKTGIKSGTEVTKKKVKRKN